LKNGVKSGVERNAKRGGPIRRHAYNNPMPTFIDESGSFGWGENASKSFTLTAVWFETPEHAVACEEAIAGVRNALGMPAEAEFHFVKTSDEQRNAFFHAVSVCQFHYVTCTLQKWRKGRWLEGSEWRKRAYFYEKLIQPVVNSLQEFLQIAEASKGGPLCERVTFDAHSDPLYYQVLRDEFYRPKAMSGRSYVKKVRPGRSESDSLVQLADMVCSSYAQSFHSSDSYVKMLKAREIEHIFIP
jgi:hypothetical protein